MTVVPQKSGSRRAAQVMLLQRCLIISAVLAVAIGDHSAAQVPGPPNAVESARTPHLLAVPLRGGAFRAALVGVDDRWTLTFAAGEQQRSVPAVDLLRWGRVAELRRGPVVVLADGGLLRADSIRYGGGRLTVESPLFGRVHLPQQLVAGVVFELPADRQEADQLLDWAGHRRGGSITAVGKHNEATNAQTHTAGCIRLTNGDELAGRITLIDGKTVRVEPAAGPLAKESLDVDRARVAAMRLSRSAKTGQTPFYVWVGMSDGSLLASSALRLADGKLRLHLLCDPSAEAGEWAASGDALVFLQPIGPKAVFLSDLGVVGYRNVPYLSMPWPYAVDRNVSGGRLRCGGRLFIKGLGVHSSARLTYLLAGGVDSQPVRPRPEATGDRQREKSQPAGLAGPFTRFEAAGGIDASAGPEGSVRFSVYVDGRQRYAGRIVRSGERPLPISVDVRGGRRLDLIVDFGDRADVQDYADWIEARLIVAEP